MATTILVHKLSQLHKTLILGRLWLEFLIEMFSKIHLGPTDFNTTE